MLLICSRMNTGSTTSSILDTPIRWDSHWLSLWRRIAAAVNILQSDIHLMCPCEAMWCDSALWVRTTLDLQLSNASPLAQYQTVSVIIGPQTPEALQGVAHRQSSPTDQRMLPSLWLCQSFGWGPIQHSRTSTAPFDRWCVCCQSPRRPESNKLCLPQRWRPLANHPNL